MEQNIKAFAITPFIAAIAQKQKRMGEQPMVNITGSTGVVPIAGEESLRTMIAACQFALGEAPAQGGW